MRLCLYNILEGGYDQNQSLRLEKIGMWLQKNEFDIVAVTEANHWEKNKEDILGKTHFPHIAVNTKCNTMYKQVFLSKFKMDRATEIGNPLWHGALHCSIMGLSFVLTHLNPFEDQKREREALFLCEMFKNFENPLFILGDMNSLSDGDRDVYISKGYKNLPEMFLAPRKFKEFGFIDILDGQNDNYTIGTALKPSEPEFRLDYIFANKKALALVNYIKVIHSEENASFSDHFPIVLDIRLE